MNKLGGLPSALAMPSLSRPARTSRRAAVARLAALLATVPAAWLGWRFVHAHGWTAQHHTSTGERRELLLSDGTRVTLNTASAIDVRFDAAQRLVVLRAGEILVATAPDTAAAHRPFRVQSGSGTMEALGTRFSVRQEEEGGATRIAVLEGAVRISPASGAASRVLPAGQQGRFSAGGIDGAFTPADEATWRGRRACCWPTACGWPTLRPSCRATGPARCIATRRWPTCACRARSPSPTPTACWACWCRPTRSMR
ncbi:FecR domain-containing protein [Variovorax sp. E3]|uniref:FecR family protein n=1 Tax=Variovorax sp. E3 TaxID=1914993 RepID=UPI0027DAD872|nr:FecR domain-containing protein [Variovorax sp. E3]